VGDVPAAIELLPILTALLTCTDDGIRFPESSMWFCSGIADKITGDNGCRRASACTAWCCPHTPAVVFLTPANN
jgi:hypothetical protein